MTDFRSKLEEQQRAKQQLRQEAEVAREIGRQKAIEMKSAEQRRVEIQDQRRRKELAKHTDLIKSTLDTLGQVRYGDGKYQVTDNGSAWIAVEHTTEEGAVLKIGVALNVVSEYNAKGELECSHFWEVGRQNVGKELTKEGLEAALLEAKPIRSHTVSPVHTREPEDIPNPSDSDAWDSYMSKRMKVD